MLKYLGEVFPFEQTPMMRRKCPLYRHHSTLFRSVELPVKCRRHPPPRLCWGEPSSYASGYNDTPF